MLPTRWQPFRDRFHIPDPSVIYLDGNSLGMPPKRTLERIDRGVPTTTGRRV